MRTSKKRRDIHYKGAVRWLLLVVCITVFVASTWLLCDYVIDSSARKRENDSLTEEYSEAFVSEQPTDTEVTPSEQPKTEESVPYQLALPETFRAMEGDLLPKAAALLGRNTDAVGWLYIEGIVDLPVAYRDNVYYLTHNFEGKADSGGALFLDENHPLQESTQFLVIHGHDMHDGSMFGKVSHYDKLSYVTKYPFAVFSTLYAREEYVIFAVLRVDPDPASEGFFNYIGRPSFGSVSDFTGYVEAMRRHSIFDIPVDVEYTDSLLALSTCVDDDRLVVVYRRVREGETREQLEYLVDKTSEK